MTPRSLPRAERASVALGSLVVAMGIVAIAGMLLAALAFGSGLDIRIPFVLALDGGVEPSGSPSVSITGSWMGAAVVVVLLALPLSVAAFRRRTASTPR
ncbi:MULTISPECIES: hypothetical protein [Clavibacter]|uniref:Uncharacterized protein n=1 Tax=Clavibacter tessellarius TaxID=31965 RepID=A0A154UX79_9MICO|nr:MULTISPECIES: hypothetical protein [Clavibacter]KZC93687.1 hypothetical protein AWH51_01265 [Clavibacter michiganensis subsp. tessellarius]MDA3803420.1 hypothetical protein [Clavibacter sp. CT19]